MNGAKRGTATFAFGATEGQHRLARDMVFYRLEASGLLEQAGKVSADPDLEAMRKAVRHVRDQYEASPVAGISPRVIRKLAGVPPK